MASLARCLCPTCGALFGEDLARGAARCSYCGRRAVLADVSRVAPRFLVTPQIDRSAAAVALRRALRDARVLPRSLRGEVQPVEQRLIFIPYHVARGIRAGVIDRPAETVRTFTTEVTDGGERRVRAVRLAGEPVEDRVRVLLTDVERSMPAVRRPGWGLEALAPETLLARGAALRPYDPGEVRRAGGAVLASDVEPAEARQRLAADFGPGRTKLVASAVRTVLLPVWRIRYRVGETLHDATLDAVTGRLLAARAPENDRFRIPLALGCLGFAGLAVGFLARVLLGVVFVASPEIFLAGGAALLVVLALFSTYAWNVVRYDAERVYEGGRLRAEYLNKPPATGLELFWQKVLGAVAERFDPLLRGRGDE